MEHRVFLTAALSALALAACGDDAGETDTTTTRTEAAMQTGGGSSDMSAEVPAVIANAQALDGRGEALLENYASQEGATRTESGLVLIPLREGDGQAPDANDIVKMNFVARVEGSDEPFESTYNNGMPVVVTPAQTLPGWAEGLPQMREGGIMRMAVPPALAFGAQGMPGGPVGPNQVTIYDVELVRVYDASDEASLDELTAEAQGQIEELTAEATRQQTLAQQAQAAIGAANRARSTLFIATQAEREETTQTDSGLVYEVLVDSGEGESPSIGDTVEVHYRGTLPTGEEFDSSFSRNSTSSFTLGQVIPGWNEGLQLMQTGDTYRFYIPSDLAYGPTGTRGGPIGPNQALVFDVELVSVSEGEAAEGGNESDGQ
jgi:FKBP-type peptidyl-prolyl cis-trans isomerase